MVIAEMLLGRQGRDWRDNSKNVCKHLNLSLLPYTALAHVQRQTGAWRDKTCKSKMIQCVCVAVAEAGCSELKLSSQARAT